MSIEQSVQKGFAYAQEVYAARGVDVEKAMETCAQVPISVHCWQGDDVSGFEGGALSGGIAATGNYPGCAKNADQLRQDLDLALGLIPGKKKVNLHAMYLESDKPVQRNAIQPAHFQGWIDWAKQAGVGLDFNPTFFSHPLSEDGFTLSHKDPEVRAFWVEHGRCCRRIGAAFGQALGQRSIVNFWMPDGYKDVPADTAAPRRRMMESLDAVFADDLSAAQVAEAVESKLFGLGVESYTVASHEFSLGYALTRKKMLCLDAGHFHPTESIAAKISACLLYMKELLLHVSRPVRWDSDHVVLWDDELRAIMTEVVRGGYLDRVNIALDFFDGSINRIAAWTIGTRNAQKALLCALLEPHEQILKAERAGDYTARLALLEENRTLPFAAVWDMYCMRQDVPVREGWLADVRGYEREVLAGR